ncbi:MAG: PilX N-terminal domain-containing pilus assembly protein [Gammaproteobacteria bacterium]|nr:PilX N-terminal domain-containing pilus assembly protein [Gammaproteobacteria bacterium]
MKKSLYGNQSGMTLVISLIILVSLTILGVTSMQATRTEISMAGNQRESGLTFNAAEAGLREAESFVEVSVSKNVYTDPGIGLYDKIDEDPDYGDSLAWVASQDAPTSLPYVVEQPKFIVKYLGDRSQNEVAAVNIGGYGSSQPGMTVSNFRITARGAGQTANSFRYVQSYFGKEF